MSRSLSLFNPLSLSLSINLSIERESTLLFSQPKMTRNNACLRGFLRKQFNGSQLSYENNNLVLQDG
jgi:hypothetical protein